MTTRHSVQWLFGAIAGVLVLAACSPAAPAAPTQAPAAQAPAAKPTAAPAPAAAAQPTTGKMIRIGITQILSHPVLDAQRNAFIDELKQAGYEDGKNISLDVQIAQNDPTLAKTIAEKFVADKVDMILALSTPSMQAAVQAAKGTNIPVLFVGVSDPIGAGVLTTVDKPSGTNVTGVYNFDPVQAQMDLAREIKPSIKTIGAVYNAGEANSVSNIKVLKDVTQKLNWKVVDATVTSSADVRTAAESLVGRVDAVYMPTDNTVEAALEALIKVTQDAKLPLFTGDVDSVKRGGLAAVGDDPEDKGRQAGDMAIRILRGEKPGEIKPEQVRKREVYVNQTTANTIGITLPDSVLKEAANVFK